MLHERIRIWLMLAPALAVIVFLFMGGLALGVLQSLGYLPLIGERGLSLAAYASIFQSRSFLRSLLLWSFAFRWAFPDVLPSEWSLRPWRYILAPESKVAEAFWNSLALGMAVTALVTLIGIPAGRALGLHQFRGKRLVEFLILAPVVVPGLAVALGIHVVFIRYNLSESFAGVVLVHLIPTTPYMTLVMASVFANYDTQFEEQARVLGAGPWRAFRLVTLPAILPGVAVGALFAFLISWSQYILTLLIGGGAVITLPLLLFSFAGSGDNGIAAALSLVFIAPVVLMLVLTSRYLAGESAAVGGFGKL